MLHAIDFSLPVRQWLIPGWLAVQVALQRFDGSVYDGFYDRQVVVMVSSEGGDAGDQPVEDKQVIPDDNVFQYEVEPGEDDKIIRVSVGAF